MSLETLGLFGGGVRTEPSSSTIQPEKSNSPIVARRPSPCVLLASTSTFVSAALDSVVLTREATKEQKACEVEKSSAVKISSHKKRSKSDSNFSRTLAMTRHSFHSLSSLIARPFKKTAPTNDQITWAISSLLGHLKHGLEVEGLFRVSGNQQQIEEYEELYLSVPDVDSSNLDILTAACVLKRLYKKIELPTAFKNELMEIKNIQNKEERNNSFKNVLSSIKPDYHDWAIIEELMLFLVSVEEKKDRNKMTVTNLAILFGPILFNAELEKIDSQNISAYLELQANANAVVGALLTYYIERVAAKSSTVAQ